MGTDEVCGGADAVRGNALMEEALGLSSRQAFDRHYELLALARDRPDEVLEVWLRDLERRT